MTGSIGEPGGAKTEVSGTSVLLSWSPKSAAKNYRVQISQRADFQLVLEQVDTDNTAYAPLLVSPTYMAGGSFWWRVAAMDAALPPNSSRSRSAVPHSAGERRPAGGGT